MSKIFALFLLCATAALVTIPAGAQAVEAARARQWSLTAGGMVSGFNPDYADPGYDGTNYLFGGGTYVDFRLSHWVQIEAEARWLRIAAYADSIENQSNYLIGPRVPIKRFGKFQTYGKALIGVANMTFPAGDYYSTGRFTALAFGGTVDYRLNRRWSIRALDFEYQDWPKFVPQSPSGSSISLQPYGISVGVGYRIF
jgi:hypothetical protein